MHMPNIPSASRPLNSRDLARNIRPVAIYHYVDALQVWLKQPLTRRQYNWLKRRCDFDPFDGPATFDPQYVQRLQIRQPSDEVLQWIAYRCDAYLNRAEFALDWVFGSEEEKEQAQDFLRRYFIKRHRGKQEISYYGGSNSQYLASRTAANVPVNYGDKECKLTGELHCLHIEWRKQGAEALRRRGITVRDLVNFNHRAFWKRRLLLYAIDPSKLGKEYRKAYRSGFRNTRYQRRKTDRIIRFGSFSYNEDREMGLRLQKLIKTKQWNETGVKQASVQAILDAYRGKKLKVGKALREIDVSHLLSGEELPDGGLDARGREGRGRSGENRRGENEIHAITLNGVDRP